MGTLNDIDHFWGNDAGLAADGDIGTVQATSRGQQRILRRLLTNPRTVNSDGSVDPADYPFHPTYGAGLARFIGQPVDTATVVALIRSQVLLEESVARVPEPQITVSLFSSGLAVTINYADAATGTAATLSFDVNQ